MEEIRLERIRILRRKKIIGIIMTKTKNHGKVNISQNKNTILIRKLERKQLP